MEKPASQLRRIALGLLAFAALAIPIACSDGDVASLGGADPALRAARTKPGNGTPPASMTTPPVPTAPLGPITIAEPAVKATVERSFTVAGDSTTIGGILQWELRYKGIPIDSGATAGGDGAPAHFQLLIHAPAPGVYEIALFEERGAQGSYSKLVTRAVKVK